MSDRIQTLKFVPEPITVDDIHVEIPKKGKIKPSIEKTSSSNTIIVEEIQIFTSTNYLPGKISFEFVEER